MRLGLISDIHGNRVALDAVLAEMPAVDHLLCAGDVVGYNPWPAECVAEIREREIPTVMGNHDRAVASSTPFAFNSMAQAGVEYARDNLDEEALAWLANLPAERLLFDGSVKVVHGHPEDPDRYTYPRDFAPGLLDGEELLVMGHTHVQHHAVFAEGIVVNPGSVGQPRDGDPDAAFAVVDLEDRTVEEYRVEYDIDRVAAAIDEAGLPVRLGQRLYKGQ
jgi:putative phosphoesterase